MHNVIIGIGLDGSPDPQAFATGVRGIIVGHGELVAEIQGVSADEEWGSEPAVWFAANFHNVQALTLAKYSLKSLATEHKQDAIAWTVGTTELVEA
jgi:hypothetical protein